MTKATATSSLALILHYRLTDLLKTLIAILLWFILFAICWPLALLLIFLLPLVWLILLPFRIVGFTLGVVFQLISSIVMLPFRLVR